MNLYIYSDESGVFDNKHEKVFVFGGVLFLSKDEKDSTTRQYSAVEKQIKQHKNIKEVKASLISNKEKKRLYSTLKNCVKFGLVINLQKLHEKTFEHKKTKQRYLDFVYKVGIKNLLLALKNKKYLPLDDVKHMYFYCDEHTTATNGRYELKEALEQEFKIGTMNFANNCYFHPITQNLNSLHLSYCNSDSVILVRSADIVANYVRNYIKHNKKIDDVYLFIFP